MAISYGKRRAAAIREYRVIKSMLVDARNSRRWELVSLYIYQIKELKIEWNL